MQSHCIYYFGGEPSAAALDILAKYTSVSTGAGFNAALGADGSTRLGRLGRGIHARNPNVEIYAYSMSAETPVRGFDYNGYGYSGAHGHYGGKLTDANWLLRRADGAFYITYGPGDGTWLPDRGTWASGVNYAVNDVVKQNGTYFKCTAAHTSPAAFSTGSGWTDNLGTMAVNYLPGVLPDHQGEDLATYHARYMKAVVLRDSADWTLTGCYLDSGIGYPDDTIAQDWLQDGVNRAPGDTPAIKRKMEEFASLYVAALKSEFGNPNFGIIGNPNSRSLGREFLETNQGSALVDGNLNESACAPAVSWSAICVDGVSGGGNSVMESGWILKSGAVKDPVNSRSIMGVQPATPTDYKTMRLGIAITLMRNGRTALSATFGGGYSAAVPLWADEFDQELGVALDPVQSAPVTGQIFKRRFENGVVLINQSKSPNLNLAPQAALNRGVWAPGTAYGEYDHVTYDDGDNRRYICKHGKAHTSSSSFAQDFAAGFWHRMTNTNVPNFVAGPPVTIDNSIIPYGVYKRFSGTQDPAVNNGEVVTQAFSLDGWDGLILLCATPGVHSL